MSYCRTGHDSDVYVWQEGKEFKWHIWPSPGDVNHPFAGVSIVAWRIHSVYNILLHMQSLGLKVPDRALSQVKAEMDYQDSLTDNEFIDLLYDSGYTWIKDAPGGKVHGETCECQQACVKKT